MPNLSQSRIGQIAVVCKDVARATAFYRDALGLPFLFDGRPNARRSSTAAASGSCSRPPSNREHDHLELDALLLRRRTSKARRASCEPRACRSSTQPHMIAKMPDHELWLSAFKDSEGNTAGPDGRKALSQSLSRASSPDTTRALNGGSPASSRRRSACAESSIGASTILPRSSDAELRAVDLLAPRLNAQAILERRDVSRRRFGGAGFHHPMQHRRAQRRCRAATSRYTACTPAAPTTLFVGHADPRVDAERLELRRHRIGAGAERAALAALDLNADLHRRRERRA